MGVMVRVIARAAIAGLVAGLAGCGADASEGAAPVVDWYVVPGRTDQAALADTCATASDGAYTVALHELPANIDDRHTELVRRLSGVNASVDVLSLETPLVAEMAGAGYLAPLSTRQQKEWGAGVAQGALAASTHDDELVAAPWWFDPQLLWFRGVAAERAGLDVSKPVAWDDLIAGADRLGVSVQVDDVDGTGISAWVAALVTAGGGAVVTGEGTSTSVSLDTAAGEAAASTIEFYRESMVGPGPTAAATTDFAAPGGGFLIAPSAALSDPSMQVVAPDLTAVPYPVIAAAAPAPASGISLAMSRDSADPAASAELISCLTAAEQQRSLVLDTGHAAARVATFDDEAVRRDSPTAAVVQEALMTAQPVPSTPYWTTVRRGIDATWLPISQVTAAGTPKESQRRIAAAVAGELP